MVMKGLTFLLFFGPVLSSVAADFDLSELLPAERAASARPPSVLEKGYVAPVATGAVDAATNAAVAAVAPVEVLVEQTAPTNETSAATAVRTGRPARITSATTYYDRKEGVVFFDRNVHVDDEQYQLHADRAYVFISGTNDLRRIVAMGHVALTNDLRRAYGTKVSYYKEGGLVVLYGDAVRPAEVRDESKAEPQVVKGSKIKFWIDSEQVEVIDADISAPVSGSSRDFKQAIRRSK